MPRLSYVNDQSVESTLLIKPWAYAATVAPGGRMDILFEVRGVEKPEIVITHRDGGEVEISLSVDLVSISGDGVEGLTARPDEAVP